MWAGVGWGGGVGCRVGEGVYVAGAVLNVHAQALPQVEIERVRVDGAAEQARLEAEVEQL